MQKYTVIDRVVLAALVVGLSTWSHANDSVILTDVDEQAYQEAYSSWKRLADIQEDAGLPPLGDPPEREDFIGISAQLAEAAEYTATARREAEARWRQRVDDVRPYLRTLMRPDDTKTKDFRTTVAQQEKGRLLQIADERFIRQPEIESDLDAISAQHGVNRVEEAGDSRFIVLGGEFDGHLLWIGSQNQIAGASIGADRLWPTNLTPWSVSNTGLDLTGTNVVLGVWEAFGAVRESHGEFQGRVVQVDQNPTNPIPLHYHPTGVAGMMAAGGILEIPSLAPGKLARGVAYQASIDAYDISLFSTEIADAVAGTTNTPGIRLSNHSYGLTSGWQFDNPAPGLWSWWGLFDVLEDLKFGWYSPDLGGGLGCVPLDTFLSEEATRHLLIYSAGNDRLIGPGSPTDYYFFFQGNWFLIQNPPSGSRLWFNGDGGTYGFDTVPPLGTAKNALTVGSVRDVYHVVGGQTNWGYSTNSVVMVSSWSAAGPTDDGRIKPDIVAVGEANPSARNYPIVTPLDTADNALQGVAGTSFAAPGVTAGLGLAFQHRSQLFPNLEPDIDDWRGSTLKALAIHTADDVDDPGPSFTTGWGLFNAVSLVRQVELDAYDGRGTHIKELFLDVDESVSWRVYSDGTEPLKVTIAWSDPAGNPAINTNQLDGVLPMLVNNLDLVIQNESQTQTWMPWILNPDLTNKTEAARSTAATTGYDDRNNVEQVYIAVPDEGNYLITVAHVGGHGVGPSPTGQWVSVISSGDTPLSPQSTDFELAPAGDEMLLTFNCDPGAYLFLETTTDLIEPQTWGLVGQIVTESVTNAVLLETDNEFRFWRLRRETP